MALAKKSASEQKCHIWTVEKLLDSIFKTSKKASQSHVVFDVYKSGGKKGAEQIRRSIGHVLLCTIVTSQKIKQWKPVSLFRENKMQLISFIINQWHLHWRIKILEPNISYATVDNKCYNKQNQPPEVFCKKRCSYAGITLAHLLHIFFNAYSANTHNINVTTLKINVIIKKHTIFSYSHIQFTTHFFDFKSKKLYGKRWRSNDPSKINRKCAENES